MTDVSVCLPVLDCSPILSSFQVILLEHIIMCRLVTGHKATALQEVCVCVCDRHCSVLLLMTVCCVTRVCVLTDLSGVSAVSAVSTALLQSRRSASHAAGEENTNCAETLIYMKN